VEHAQAAKGERQEREREEEESILLLLFSFPARSTLARATLYLPVEERRFMLASIVPSARAAVEGRGTGENGGGVKKQGEMWKEGGGGVGAFFFPLPQLITLSLSSLFFDLDEQSSISDALASLVRPARASPAPGIPSQPRALRFLL
jgi:hypothetical protein